MQRVFPPELTSYVDSSTGAKVLQWTGRASNDQHLYFTSPSVTRDDRWLVCLSDRCGSPNLFGIDRQNGDIYRLSNNDGGLLHSYVYPQGGSRGLSKASPCLDDARARLYYVRDDAVWAVDLAGGAIAESEICRLPAGWIGAFTHNSPDGKTLCVPVTDPRAFADPCETQWEQMRKVPARMEAEYLPTRIYLIDVASGAPTLAAEVPFWVTHVQFDPLGSGRIVFNREGFVKDGHQPPPNRIWCLEPRGEFRPLSPEPEGEWRSHENWSPDGRGIVYHGGRKGSDAFVALRSWEGELLRETVLPGVEFWHAIGAPDGRRLLVDRPTGMVSIIDPFSPERSLVDLCRHDSIVENQDAHPHPVPAPKGNSVVFTSIRGGTCNVYEVLIDGLGIPWLNL